MQICLITLFFAYVYLTETLKVRILNFSDQILTSQPPPPESLELDEIDDDDIEQQPLWGPVTGQPDEVGSDDESGDGHGDGESPNGAGSGNTRSGSRACAWGAAAMGLLRQRVMCRRGVRFLLL